MAVGSNTCDQAENMGALFSRARAEHVSGGVSVPAIFALKKEPLIVLPRTFLPSSVCAPCSSCSSE